MEGLGVTLLARNLGFDEFGAGVRPLEAMPRAKRAAQHALELQPDLAEAHAVLGIIATCFDWDWATAERELALAASLKPTASLALLWYAILLSITGRHEESLRASLRGQAVEPLLAGAQTSVGRSLYYAGRLDEAERAFRAVLEMEPGYVPVHIAAARLYVAMGRPDEALRLLEQAVGLIGRRTPLMIAMIGGAHAWLGHEREALAALEELEHARRDSYVPIIYNSVISSGLGRSDDAFGHLERACDERSGWLPFTLRDPVWAPAREHPRYQALMQRVGLLR